jgi:hypothetical protein
MQVAFRRRAAESADRSTLLRPAWSVLSAQAAPPTSRTQEYDASMSGGSAEGRRNRTPRPLSSARIIPRWSEFSQAHFRRATTARNVKRGGIPRTGREDPDVLTWLLAFPLVIVLGECAAWWWLVRSYRQLNTAKFKVVGALEERLPASPYWRAEWAALGEGKDWRKYLPLTHLEQWIPVLFGLVYVIGFGVVVAT